MSARHALNACRVLFLSAMSADDAEAFDAALNGELTPREREQREHDAQRRAAKVQSWGGVATVEEG